MKMSLCLYRTVKFSFLAPFVLVGVFHELKVFVY